MSSWIFLMFSTLAVTEGKNICLIFCWLIAGLIHNKQAMNVTGSELLTKWKSFFQPTPLWNDGCGSWPQDSQWKSWSHHEGAYWRYPLGLAKKTAAMMQVIGKILYKLKDKQHSFKNCLKNLLDFRLLVGNQSKILIEH